MTRGQEQLPVDPLAVLIQGLRFAYPDGTEALSGVDLRIQKGESVAVIGPNGAGKSTLLLHLNGILRGQGTIEIFGLPVEERTLREIRRRVGVVFQDPDDQLFLTTVSQDVAFGPANLGLPEDEIAERVHEALDAVGMAQVADRAAHHLSFGQKKRVATATVLSMRPDVLVLDEPSSNLDPKARRQLVGILRSLPVTKIIVTHDLPYAFEMCERAVILSAGRVIADGPIADILGDAGLLARHELELPYGFEPRRPSSPLDAAPSAPQGRDGLTDPALAEQPEETVLALHTTGAYWKLSGSVARLKAGMAERGLEARGPLVGLFLDDPDKTPAEHCRYVLAYPVEAGGVQPPPAEAADGPALRLEVLPAGTRAVIEYEGPAGESPRAYERLEEWLAARGLRPQGPPEEVYLAEPGTLGRGLMKARIRRRLVPEGLSPRG